MFVMIIIAQNGACIRRLNSIGELNSGLSSVGEVLQIVHKRFD